MLVLALVLVVEIMLTLKQMQELVTRLVRELSWDPRSRCRIEPLLLLLLHHAVEMGRLLLRMLLLLLRQLLVVEADGQAARCGVELLLVLLVRQLGLMPWEAGWHCEQATQRAGQGRWGCWRSKPAAS